MASINSAEGALRLGISHSHLRRLIRDGVIKAKNVGTDSKPYYLLNTNESSFKNFERSRKPKK